MVVYKPAKKVALEIAAHSIKRSAGYIREQPAGQGDSATTNDANEQYFSKAKLALAELEEALEKLMPQLASFGAAYAI